MKIVEEGISTIANVKNFLSLRMGRGRADYIQNNEYLITAMFQSRVYMIRKSIIKHIFFFCIYGQNETAKTSKLYTTVLGILVVKSRPFFFLVSSSTW